MTISLPVALSDQRLLIDQKDSRTYVIEATEFDSEVVL